MNKAIWPGMIGLSSLVVAGSAFAQPTSPRVANFGLEQVRLLPGPFQEARQRDLRYLLSLDSDRLLVSFRSTAAFYTGVEYGASGRGARGKITAPPLEFARPVRDSCNSQKRLQSCLWLTNPRRPDPFSSVCLHASQRQSNPIEVQGSLLNMHNIYRPVPLLVSLVLASLLTGLPGPLAAQTNYTPRQFITIAGLPGNSGSANGTGSAARFLSPEGVTVDGSGNIYVADSGNNTIREIAPGGVVTTIAGTPGTAGQPGAHGGPTLFRHPVGVAVDTAADLILVADSQNTQWQGISPTVSGGVTTWVAANVGTFSSFNQPGSAASAPVQLTVVPIGVAIAPNGSIGYGTVVGTGSSGAAMVEEPFSGTYSPFFLAGNPTGANGSTNGNGTSATFNNPQGIAVDASTDLYIADSGNDVIRKITPTVGSQGTQYIVSTIAGTAGAQGSADGSASAALFNAPNGIALDTNGNMFIADTGNNTIREISASGVVTTLAGVPGVAGSADGTGSGARFSQPYGIAVDAKGNLYVSDTGNNTIREGLAPSVAPTFTLVASPATATVATGRTAVFNAIATGTPVPTYQWTLNGSATIPGATVTNDPILVITGATSADIGSITCTATSTAGSVSSSATLSVVAAANPGYLTNLSGRGLVGSGASNALFGGFGISGSGTKQLLIRGMGPSLSPGYIFAVSDALTSTTLALYNSSQAVLAQNTGWGGTPALMTANALVGAYPPISTTSLDSILYLPVATGSSSASVGGVGGATGDAVIELYDADAPPLTTKLTNVAVRAPVGTGNDILFGGFSIGGTTAETVLIRAIGPRLGLSPFNLSPVLAQPVLTVYLGGTPTGYSNTGWGGDPALVNAMATVGAYALTASSQDSLLLVTLPPGGYSAEVSGLGGTTGIAAVEVYEVY